MYIITFRKSAEKEIYKLPFVLIKRVEKAIDNLAIQPRPNGVKKLQGQDENLWRIRVGDYRIVYLIADEIRIIEIRKVAHRKDVYL